MRIPIEETHEDRYLRLLSEAYDDQRENTAEILDRCDRSEAIRTLMRDAGVRAANYEAAAHQVSPPTEPLACGKGCEHCCWATVGVVAPEAIHLAEELRAALPEEEFAVLREKTTHLAAKLQGMQRGERLEARVPCALLRDGACSAYEHRPLVCRWACSSSLQSCMDHLIHKKTAYLEMEAVRYQPIQEVWRGKREGLRNAGLDASLLALNSALAIALAAPDIAERYLAGEPVFEDVRLD